MDTLLLALILSLLVAIFMNSQGKNSAALAALARLLGLTLDTVLGMLRALLGRGNAHAQSYRRPLGLTCDRGVPL